MLAPDPGSIEEPPVSSLTTKPVIPSSTISGTEPLA